MYGRQGCANEYLRVVVGPSEGERNCVSKSGRASAFPAQHVRYGETGAALLHGILISVNYSRKWHVLLTSALSTRRSGRIQFSRPSARSTLSRSPSPTSSRVNLVARRRRHRRRWRVRVAVARRGSNRRVLPRDG